MSRTEMGNMVMIQDPETGKVLVQNRIKSWKGLSFPGGHVEKNESFLKSAMREVKEETGLDIDNVHFCGVVHWLNLDLGERYLVFLYKTSDFSGNLITDHEEGQNAWMTIDDFRNRPSENDAVKYLPLFLDDSLSEAFGAWHSNSPQSYEITYL